MRLSLKFLSSQSNHLSLRKSLLVRRVLRKSLLLRKHPLMVARRVKRRDLPSALKTGNGLFQIVAQRIFPNYSYKARESEPAMRSAQPRLLQLKALRVPALMVVPALPQISTVT